MGREIEEWRDVPNYEGYYQVSSLGRVRSLDRTVMDVSGYRNRHYKGKAIKGGINGGGYMQTTLNKNGKGRCFKFSQLVAMVFLGHKPDKYKFVVDHINGDKSDDRVENLRIVTNRANCSTCFRSDKEKLSSTYIGVTWDKVSSKWSASIRFDGGSAHLGRFANEVDASYAYELALSKIKDGSFNPDDYKRKCSSEHKGVSFRKDTGKWRAYIAIDDKRKCLGSFQTEMEAHKAYLRASNQRQ